VSSSLRRHIVLATIGSLGDLHPMIALALELRRRGHQATIATTEAYRQKIEATGIGFCPMRPEGSPEDSDLARHIMDLKKGPEFIIRQLLMPHLREMYDDLAAIAASADFMIAGEIVFAAPLVAEKLKLPWASAILSPASFFSVYDPGVIAPLPFTRRLHGAPRALHRMILGLGKWATRDWGRPVAELRRALGLAQAADPLFTDKFSPRLNLAMFSPVLARPQPDWPPATLQTGFVFYDKQEHEPDSFAQAQAFLAAGEAPIVFTLGSAAVLDARSFFDESARAAEKLGRRALLLAGKNVVRHVLPSTIAVFGYAPYSEILPRAACVVHQGGVGTTAQALRAGVPQLLMPYGFDQPDNAARVERLGVARGIGRSQYTAARATKLLSHLLDDPAYARRSAAIGRQIRAENGLAAACDAIEAQMRKG